MVGMKREEGAAKGERPNEQLLYARVLDWGVKAGLALLIAGFAAYVGGALPAQVPLEELPRLWALPAGEYLSENGAWDAAAMLARGDTLALAGVVFLASLSIPCQLLLAFAYAARRDWSYLAIAAALAGVLLLAASGALVAH
jgi:uncharacterized paraquat-inducible protein A